MRYAVLAFTLVLGVASAGRAQETCFEQVKFPAVGRWAEYQAVYNKKDPYTVRYAVIGSERREGQDMKWVELKMTGKEKDKNLIYQMLVPGSPTELANVQEIVFKPGDKPAMKMSGMMVKMIRDKMGSQAIFSELCKDVTLVGSESVTVPAGKFQTQHFQSAKYSSDSWLSAAIPFSMVKAAGKDYAIALSAQGEGAKSSITETPQSMGGMGEPPNK